MHSPALKARRRRTSPFPPVVKHPWRVSPPSVSDKNVVFSVSASPIPIRFPVTFIPVSKSVTVVESEGIASGLATTSHRSRRCAEQSRSAPASRSAQTRLSLASCVVVVVAFPSGDHPCLGSPPSAPSSPRKAPAYP